MKEKEIYNLPYPRIVYNESQDIKGLLVVSSVMGAAYLLFIMAIGYKLGFM